MKHQTIHIYDQQLPTRVLPSDGFNPITDEYNPDELKKEKKKRKKRSNFKNAIGSDLKQ